jgi:L-ribulose-5-phosphate 4-epimerase
MLLQKNGLITLTWGNVSEIDRALGLVAIKPSGVGYDTMCPDDIVVTDLDGGVIEGALRPSSDLPTHLALYKSFPDIGAVAHTHSRWATVFAQAKRSVPMLGTTHADTFYGDVPCTRELTEKEIAGEYERETGTVIAEAFADRDYEAIPGVLVASHGPFTWGKDAIGAVNNSVVLEEVAMMAYHTLVLNADVCFDGALADKHYFRKHGEGAYYGQVAKK